MIYEAECTRCGQKYLFKSLKDTDHRGFHPERNGPCMGLPRRIYELHTSPVKLIDSLLERLLNPKKVFPLLKYRPRPTFVGGVPVDSSSYDLLFKRTGIH